MRVPAGAILAAVLVAAASVRAADLDAIERSVRQQCAERDRLVAERTGLMQDAGALADEIGRLKGRSAPAPRADRALEDALQRFDRVAERLDALDRNIADRNRSIDALHRRFENAATDEASRLTSAGPGPLGGVARRLAAIEASRRRVADLVASETSFRPALEVAFEPADGPADIHAKLEILEAEHERVAKRLVALEQESDVVAERIVLKRRFSTRLQDAVRTAGPDLDLLRTEADDTAQALDNLATQHAALEAQKQDLERSLERMQRIHLQLDARLEEVETKGDHP